MGTATKQFQIPCNDFIALSILDNDLLVVSSGLVFSGLAYMTKFLSFVNKEDPSLSLKSCSSDDDDPLRVVCELAFYLCLVSSRCETWVFPNNIYYARIRSCDDNCEIPFLFLYFLLQILRLFPYDLLYHLDLNDFRVCL